MRNQWCYGMTWKPIPNTNGEYEASDTGLIRSVKAGKPPRVLEMRFGSLASGGSKYYRVCMSIKGKVIQNSVHRLVAMTWLPNPFNLPQVNHKDGDPRNNCVDNLEWVTALQNIAHAVKNGFIKRGERSPIAKFSDAKIAEVRAFIAANPHISLAAVGRQFGMSGASVRLYHLGYRSSVSAQTGLPPMNVLP